WASHTSLGAFTQRPVALDPGGHGGLGREFHCCPSHRKMVVSPASHTSVEPLPRTIVSPSVVGTETTAQVPGRPTLPTMPPLLHAPNPIGREQERLNQGQLHGTLPSCLNYPDRPRFPLGGFVA